MSLESLSELQNVGSKDCGNSYEPKSKGKFKASTGKP